jgi:DNA-directed RNA polymerase specialized sigma24 family protein
MSDASYERHFEALHKGETTFDQFVQATRPLWNRLAASLRRRWKVGEWYDHEDTVSELLMAAWKFVWKYDSSRSVRGGLQRYVVYNAMDKAKKALHVARGADRSKSVDKAPSRIECPLSAYGTKQAVEGDLSRIADDLLHRHGEYAEPEQELRLIEREEKDVAMGRALGHATSLAEMHVIEALAETGSAAVAAKRMWNDVEVRVELNLEDEAAAHRAAQRTTRQLAKRMAAA